MQPSSVPASVRGRRSRKSGDIYSPVCAEGHRHIFHMQKTWGSPSMRFPGRVFLRCQEYLGFSFLPCSLSQFQSDFSSLVYCCPDTLTSPCAHNCCVLCSEQGETHPVVGAACAKRGGELHHAWVAQLQGCPSAGAVALFQLLGGVRADSSAESLLGSDPQRKEAGEEHRWGGDVSEKVSRWQRGARCDTSGNYCQVTCSALSSLGNGMLVDTCVRGPSSCTLGKETGVQGLRARDGLWRSPVPRSCGYGD